MGLRRTVVLAAFHDFIGNESRWGYNVDCDNHDRSVVTDAYTVTPGSAPTST